MGSGLVLDRSKVANEIVRDITNDTEYVALGLWKRLGADGELAVKRLLYFAALNGIRKGAGQ